MDTSFKKWVSLSPAPEHMIAMYTKNGFPTMENRAADNKESLETQWLYLKPQTIPAECIDFTKMQHVICSIETKTKSIAC